MLSECVVSIVCVAGVVFLFGCPSVLHPLCLLLVLLSWWSTGGGEMVRSPREEFPLVCSLCIKFLLQPADSDITSLAVCDDNSGEFCNECETVIS